MPDKDILKIEWKYIISLADTPCHLSDFCTARLNQGWTPVGGVALSTLGPGGIQWAQAFKKQCVEGEPNG